MEDRHAARNRGIHRALMTSVVARMSGVLLQVVSLPIAATHLGPAGFSIYAMLGAILAAMTLSNLGMSQSTTLHMSRALAAGDRAAGREMLTGSLVIVGGLAFAVSALTALLVLFTPLLSLVFARHLENSAEPVMAALFICFVLLATQLLSVMEAAQLAQQRQHRLNIATSLGTLIAAGAVWWVATNDLGLVGILVAVHLPVILLRGLNAGTIWADLRPRLRDLAPALMHARVVLGDGLRFLSGTTIANFLCHPFSVLAVGMFAAPQPSAAFAAVMNGVIVGSSVLGLIVTPYRGALPEAYRRGDHVWVRQAMMRILGFNLTYGLLICLTLGISGQWVIAMWYGDAVTPGRVELLGAGIYFVLLAVEATNFIYLSSTGHLHATSRWLLIKSVIAAVGITVAAAFGADALVFWILAAANLLFSLIPLGILSFRRAPPGHPDNHG